MTPTVLIIDDDPGFRAALTELLAERGYRLVG
jgi:FixJ family two-component response regulator